MQGRSRLIAFLLAGAMVAAPSTVGLLASGQDGPPTDVETIDEPKPCVPHPPIEITEDEGPAGFVLGHDPATGEPIPRPGSGVVAGDGTENSPYVIEGWCIRIVDPPSIPFVSSDVPPREVADGIRIHDTSSHVVVRDNALTAGVDGDQVPLEGAGEGIEVTDASNVVLEDNDVVGVNGEGILIEDAPGTEVRENTVSENGHDGIDVRASDGVEIDQNVVTGNGVGTGISLHSSDDTRVVDNELHDNTLVGLEITDSAGATVEANAFDGEGVSLRGDAAEHYRHTIEASNTVDGDPIRYVRDADGTHVTGPAGQVIVVEAENVTLQGLDLEDTSDGVQAAWAHNLTVEGSSFQDHRVAIRVLASNDLLVEANTVQANEVPDVDPPPGSVAVLLATEGALQLEEVDRFRVSNNTVHENTEGLRALASTEGSIQNNSIKANADDGVSLRTSQGIELVHNTIRSNGADGISLSETSDIAARENNLQGNEEAGLEATDTDDDVDAMDNWWGHPSGPAGDVEDACTDTVTKGDGDAIVTENAGVCFDPWRSSPNPEAGPN